MKRIVTKGIRVGKSAVVPLLTSFLLACSTTGTVQNSPMREDSSERGYSLANMAKKRRDGDFSLVLAFSGGGTRAAAMAYGVLQGLREVQLASGSPASSLLDEVDMISSVSGGSFTAAYYGLHGDRMFLDFQSRFLRADVSRALAKRVLRPAALFSERGRTDHAVTYYEDTVFGGATFADLERAGGPMIIINATDLGGGVRFSFTQEYFDLLCSDLSSYPVARAVTASSAVPLVFHPVVLENYGQCQNPSLRHLSQRAEEHQSSQVRAAINDLKSYTDRNRRQYVHLVDGGISDNLGLMAIYEMIEVAGGPTQFFQHLGIEARTRFALISVNASTNSQTTIEQSPNPPTLEDTVNAVTDIQLHRYNAATVDLIKDSLDRWTEELSAQGRAITPYFVEVNFDSLPYPEQQLFFNQIPTSLTITEEQVDNLIAVGRQLLLENPEFRRFVQDVGGRLPN